MTSEATSQKCSHRSPLGPLLLPGTQTPCRVEARAAGGEAHGEEARPPSTAQPSPPASSLHQPASQANEPSQTQILKPQTSAQSDTVWCSR